MMKESETYSFNADEGILNVSEPAAALQKAEEFLIPDDISYANVTGGILQITPDIEEEIAAAEQGETVSMSEFKTMFSKWLD